MPLDHVAAEGLVERMTEVLAHLTYAHVLHQERCHRLVELEEFPLGVGLVWSARNGRKSSGLPQGHPHRPQEHIALAGEPNPGHRGHLVLKIVRPTPLF